MTQQQITNVPSDYTSYNHMVFCSNTLENVKYIVQDKDFYPLLIGLGSIPKVWLYAKSDTGEPITLIDKNIALYSTLSVNIDDDIKKLSVVFKDYKMGRVDILKIDYSQQSLVVENIDLNPIGYNITGTPNSLNIGTNTISNNTLVNVQSFIFIG